MGKQSSRIVKLNSDHKDISNNGVSHFQLWHNGELLWEKLPSVLDYDFALTAKPIGLSARPANFQIKGNVTIDWGDGTIQNVNASSLTKVQRVYSSSGLYVIKISGNIEDMSFKYSQGIYSIDTPFPATMSAKTDFSEMFYTATDTVNSTAYDSTYRGGFAKNLFKNCVNAVNFTKCFYGIKDLTLPTRLFWNCKKAETFDYCFQSCTFAEALPDDIFEYTNNAKTFIGAFESSEVIVPQRMFANCAYATDFTECFGNAKVISDAQYPSNYSETNKPMDYLNNMFSGLTNAVSFKRCFYFAEVRGGYTNEGYTAQAFIGDDFFSNCTSVETFEGCFSHSTGIKGISEELFDDCQNVDSFANTFFSCTSIISNVPALWERNNVESYAGCYDGCTNAQNYADIPDAWK